MSKLDILENAVAISSDPKIVREILTAYDKDKTLPASFKGKSAKEIQDIVDSYIKLLKNYPFYDEWEPILKKMRSSAQYGKYDDALEYEAARDKVAEEAFKKWQANQLCFDDKFRYARIMDEYLPSVSPVQAISWQCPFYAHMNNPDHFNNEEWIALSVFYHHADDILYAIHKDIADLRNVDEMPDLLVGPATPYSKSFTKYPKIISQELFELHNLENSLKQIDKNLKSLISSGKVDPKDLVLPVS